MVIIPAIDVQRGLCVRLRQGEHGSPTVYAADPAEVARSFIDTGARRLHVVNLDAARGRATEESAAAVERIVAVCTGSGCEVQVGGGVRNVEAALRWLDAGVSFVILGSVAAREPEAAEAICEAARGKVLLGLDVSAGVARVRGWTEDGLTATELLRSWRRWHAAGIVYTDIMRDGLMSGPDLDGLRTCRELYAGPVFVSGGVSSLADIAECAMGGAAGVVVGKALYEGRIDLGAALRSVKELAR